KVDQSEIDVLRKTYQDEIDSLSKQIHILAEDDTFNINSPKQLGAILFDKLKLPAAKKNRNGYSTDASTLEKLVDKHDIVKYVLRYRQIMKLLSTYIDGLSSQINVESGKIHTIFNQALTVTGRLSSKEPNLQNIPVRSPEGRVLRKLFIPSSSDNLLVSADYSQIELRLLAHFSRDKALIEAYENGEDIHRFTASKVFNVSLNEVTSEMRSASKAVNFGIIYGISDFGLAQQIGVSVKTAKAYIERYFEKYPTVKAYMNSNVEFCKINGYVTTITGRRRKIREINSQNFMQRSFGERAAMNMPLQGSSADIIKICDDSRF
ncbi:MAG: DNA polymerase, partial [Clostridia bacterium]